MSDFAIEVTGFNIPDFTKAVQGVSVHYRANTIPTATLTLDAPWIVEKAKDLLCNPDKYKNRDNLVTIRIAGPGFNNCLTFEGYFDGLTTNHVFGGYSYVMEIKSKFQRLLEVFPKYLGLVPGSSPAFVSRDPTGIAQGDEFYFGGLLSEPVTRTNAFPGAVEFYIEVMKSLVQLQTNERALEGLGQYSSVEDIINVFKTASYKKNIKEAIALMDKLDTTYVKNCQLTSSAAYDHLLTLIVSHSETLLGDIMSVLAYFGCVLLMGNTKVWIVPEASFLKANAAGSGVPTIGQLSAVPNTAYPADYSMFNVNDSAYRNINHAFVGVVPPSYTASVQDDAAFSKNVGRYSNDDNNEIEDDGSSGVLFVQGDEFLAGAFTVAATNLEVQQDLNNPAVPNCAATVTDPEAERKKKEEQHKQIEENAKKWKEHLDLYAKTKFLQYKFGDRTGNILLPFDLSWIPGTIGKLASSLPTMWWHFYVDTVTHTVMKTENNTASATTSVNFSHARYNGSSAKVPGVDKVPLFDYTTQKMVELQNAWLKDIGYTL